MFLCQQVNGLFSWNSALEFDCIVLQFKDNLFYAVLNFCTKDKVRDKMKETYVNELFSNLDPFLSANNKNSWNAYIFNIVKLFYNASITNNHHTKIII